MLKCMLFSHQLLIVMVYTCEHISWPQGTPFHLQFLQPFEGVLEVLEEAVFLPVQNTLIAVSVWYEDTFSFFILLQ